MVRLLRAMRPWFSMLLVVAVATGLRVSETVDLAPGSDRAAIEEARAFVGQEVSRPHPRN